MTNNKPTSPPKKYQFLPQWLHRAWGIILIAAMAGLGIAIYPISQNFIRPVYFIWLVIGLIVLAILVINRSKILSGFANLPLRIKLAIAFLAVAVVSIGVVTSLLNQVVSNDLSQAVGTSLQILAQGRAQQISELLNKESDILQALAISRAVEDFYLTDATQYGDDLAQIQERLQQYDVEWAGLADNDPAVQKILKNRISQDLLKFQASFTGQLEVLATNKYGALVGATQRTGNFYYADQVWWQSAYNNGEGEVYIGQPEFNEQAAEFGIPVAAPVRGTTNQQVIGVMYSFYSLEDFGNVLASARFGETGKIEIYLPDGREIDVEIETSEAVEETAAAEAEETEEEFELEVEEAEFERTALSPSAIYALVEYDERPSIVSQAQVSPFEADEAVSILQLDWWIVAHQEQAEALVTVSDATQTALVASLGAILLAGMLAIFVTQALVAPVNRLTAVATQIAGGNLSAQAPIEAKDEIGELANTFNRMTGQLRQTLQGLEQRTTALQTNAEISRRLATILHQSELVSEVVEQVQAAFDYYHVHIYLFDETQEYLVMVGGTGEAGRSMLAAGHKIPQSKGLVGRAAETKEVVLVSDVSQNPAWLPNPLLPETKSEIAVPIILGEQVIGVLDVQDDEVGSLGEGDSVLLLTLAGQVAVAIRNARAFTQIEAALKEARELQQRFIAQSWDRAKVSRKGAARVQFSLGESTTLSETLVANAQQEALKHKKPTTVTFSGQENGLDSHRALVAPILLQDVAIGDLQLHEIDPDRKWTENEMALIDAVVDQVAQAAETLRLLDETQERATREQLISQISNKMRHAPDMESLLKVAVSELSNVLGPARTFIHIGPEVAVNNQQTANNIKENGDA